MTQETLARLIREYIASNGDDIPLYVSSLIEQERSLSDRIRDIRHRMREQEERHAKERAGILNQLNLVQNECQHHETNYQGDPSGGSDRSETCLLCGKELAR